MPIAMLGEVGSRRHTLKGVFECYPMDAQPGRRMPNHSPTHETMEERVAVGAGECTSVGNIWSPWETQGNWWSIASMMATIVSQPMRAEAAQR
eukprot:scaffold343577_cov23-Prasinocladus_malaysianus.AAC.1